MPHLIKGFLIVNEVFVDLHVASDVFLANYIIVSLKLACLQIEFITRQLMIN